jgi:hypothetical protein
MANHNGNGTVPPFHKPPVPPQNPLRNSPYLENKRKMIRQASMLVGFLGLTIAMAGGAKLMFDILTDVSNLTGLLAKVISLGLSFLLGWVVSLVCIRGMGNLVLPLIIKAYIFLTACGILGIYARVVYKLFMELFRPDVHYVRYSIAIFTGFAVLVGLHLLLEDHDLRPFSIPFLVAGVMHLAAMVAHYVFLDAELADITIAGDVYFFAVLMVIAILMLVHLGIFNIPRNIINYFFAKNRSAAPAQEK